jgi:L-lactate dehydrogenase (cytochrome)
MASIVNVSDMETLARRRIPGWVFDYAAGGSYDERTLHANQNDLARLTFDQRVMVDVSSRKMATTIVGIPTALPIGIAPTGLAGFFHPDGEIHAARAAIAADIPYCLSTVSICSIEDVRAAAGPFWFQIYVMRDRGFTRSLIERARLADCPALVLTLDLPLQAQRHRDIRNGLVIPPRFTLKALLEMTMKARWSLGMAKAGRFDFGNFKDAPKTGGMASFARWVADSFDPTFTWGDVAWIRENWPGKLILKGILNADDAKMAMNVGADAIVVSNHGGRQLDGAPSTISVLPEIADTLGGKTEIIFDSGIRSGQDVLKALALGARYCLIGRAHLYGLAAGGQSGVAKVIDIMRRELDVSMALTGSSDVVRIDPSVVRGYAKTA